MDDTTWALVETERRTLADLPDGLTPEQWEAKSLCTEGRIRDVSAHLTMPAVGALDARRRLTGLCMRAGDCDWSSGTGPEVSGSAGALLLLMNRHTEAALDLLHGPGVDALTQRTAARLRTASTRPNGGE